MKRPEPKSAQAQRNARTAAEWLVRRERGLTPAEQDEFLQWLSADARRGEWLALHQQMVGDFALLTQWRPEHSSEPNPDLLARPRRRSWRIVPLALGAAASIALGLLVWRPSNSEPRDLAPAVPAAAAGYERRLLEDGSVVELNRGAVIAVQFTASERHVTLEQGEALFTVTKNPLRPFIVRARGVDVRAVGTAFNVRVGSDAVEVFVTEGRVQVAPPSQIPVVGELPMVVAGQRAVVSLAANTLPQIAAVSADEAEQLLAWQPQLLDFSSAPLTRVIEEFNRRNRIQLVLADPALAEVPIVASIRSDKVESLVHFLTLNAGVRAEHRGANEIVLHRK